MEVYTIVQKQSQPLSHYISNHVHTSMIKV